MSTSDACVAGVGVPLLAAGGGAGVITVWDLEQRRLQVLQVINININVKR